MISAIATNTINTTSHCFCPIAYPSSFSVMPTSLRLPLLSDVPNVCREVSNGEVRISHADKTGASKQVGDLQRLSVTIYKGYIHSPTMVREEIGASAACQVLIVVTRPCASILLPIIGRVIRTGRHSPSAEPIPALATVATSCRSGRVNKPYSTTSGITASIGIPSAVHIHQSVRRISDRRQRDADAFCVSVHWAQVNMVIASVSLNAPTI
jgi:hypothetical protein